MAETNQRATAPVGAVRPTVHVRKTQLIKDIEDLGLTITFGSEGSLITIENAFGGRETMWGLWCAEIFVKGYKFATSNSVPKEKLGMWKDDDLEWDDDDD